MIERPQQPPPLVDTHAHLGDSAFDADREAVLQRARRVGVARVVCVAEDLLGSRRALELGRAHPMLAAAAGLHPDRVVDQDAEQLLGEAEAIHALLRSERDRFCAIGEVGLDFWRARTPAQRELQVHQLKAFVALSLELDLPLSVHSRSAGRQCLELLIDAGARRVVLHAFDGRAARARPGVDAGYYFSVPVSVVRSRQKQKLLRQLPVDRLLLESDAPVLGPEPGTRNEPANLTLAVAEIAKLTGRSEAEIDAATTDNALRCFGWSAEDLGESPPAPPRAEAHSSSPGEQT